MNTSTIQANITVRPDFLFKVISVGDSGVGKSCLLLRYVDDVFTDSFITTIGVDFRLKTLMGPETNNKFVKLQIWDTAGQERFRYITRNFFRQADLVLFCADLTDQQSFENLTNWNEDMLKCNPSGVLACVVGTKSDIVDKRVVSRQMAEEYAKKLGYPYVETSSKTGSGVEQCFDKFVSKMIAQKMERHAQVTQPLLDVKKKTKPVYGKVRLFGLCNII
jgi:Ras-related protein Rab-1A